MALAGRNSGHGVCENRTLGYKNQVGSQEHGRGNGLLIAVSPSVADGDNEDGVQGG